MLFFICFNNETSEVFKTNNTEKYIYIDPGHGGIDGGAISRDGIYEKTINLSISYYLKQYLENSGFNVKMTRYSDYDLANYNSKNRKMDDLNKRINLINNDNNLLFISIHCNIYKSSKIKGAQTFYKNTQNNKLLANIIQNKLINILKNTNRQSKIIKNKYLLDNVQTVGCLVEVGFLSNEEELQLLKTKKYQQEIACCIYIGILEYLNQKNYF